MRMRVSCVAKMNLKRVSFMIKLLLLVMVLAMAMVMVMGIKYLTAGQTPSPSSDDGNE